ncbi:hypothetical protein L7F22_025358 [Adiantum nelumboides]|nr:hypothetical protein [Adiantum nelumboides]
MDAREGDDEKSINNANAEKDNMLNSKLVKEETLKLWELQRKKTQKKLSQRNPQRDDKFQLITENINDQPSIRVWCNECKTSYGSGVITGKQSAYSSLSNFMRFHILEGQAHQKRYFSNRGLKLDPLCTHGSTMKGKEDDHNDATIIITTIEELHKFNDNHEGATACIMCVVIYLAALQWIRQPAALFLVEANSRQGSGSAQAAKITLG